MVDLILINEDACVLGNEIPIKCDVSRGAGEEKYNQRKVIKKTIYMLKKQIYCCQNFRSYQCGMVKGTYEA